MEITQKQKQLIQMNEKERKGKRERWREREWKSVEDKKL